MHRKLDNALGNYQIKPSRYEIEYSGNFSNKATLFAKKLWPH